MGEVLDLCVDLGEQESQDALWRRVWTQVMVWVRRRVRSLHDAEDLVAECVEVVLLKFPGLLPSWQRLRTWLSGVVRNRVAAQFRASSRLVVLGWLDPDLVAAPAAVAHMTVAELRGVAPVAVRGTLSMLVAGADDGHAARAQGISVRTVRAHRACLGRLVRGCGVFPGICHF